MNIEPEEEVAELNTGAEASAPLAAEATDAETAGEEEKENEG